MPKSKRRIKRARATVEGLESRLLRHGGLAGSGLFGQYFDNKDFTNEKFARVDAAVNFSWGTASPSSAQIAPDTFSVRWTGQIIPHKTESYTFYTSTDDGVRLWIGGQLVIDKLVNQPATTYATKPIALTEGVPVDVRMDYYENTGGAVAKLMWASASTPKQIIPQDHLLPEALPPSPPPPPPPPPSPSTASTIRIDAAGARSYTDADGKVWAKDTYYSGGSATLGAFDIAGTSDDVMYYERRFGKSFSYAIPISAAGDYRVTLHFADASYNTGGRKFNVTAEGKTVLSNFDITAEAGGVKGVAVTKSFDLAVIDGKLNLAFTGVVNNATLSAIEVTPLAVGTHIDWQTVAPSPVARAEASGTVVNGKLYAFGGYVVQDGAIIAQSRCDVYDPATNTWTRLGDMPENFTHAGIAVDGADIYLVGQYAGNHPGPGSTHVWRYNTLGAEWTRVPDLPAPRGAGAAAIVGRQLHFFGGMDETRTIECGDHWSLDLDHPELGWTERANMPNPRNHISAASLNGKIYAIGGQHGQEEDQIAQSEVDCYDPETDTWTVVAPLPDIRSHTVASTFVMDGKIVVLGGEVGFNIQRSTVYAYDPTRNEWSLLGTLPAPRSTSIAGALGTNTIITTCGNSPDATSATWIGTVV
jgi:N-acetylneuraminic acid mutarotase